MKVKETYAIVTEESAQHGDYAEHGWIDEEGEEFSANNLQAVVEYLTHKFVREASCSHFCQGIWYSSEPDMNYKTGEEETRSFHLYGLTRRQEKFIARRLNKACRLGMVIE
jgi:hypothetical protein